MNRNILHRDFPVENLQPNSRCKNVLFSKLFVCYIVYDMSLLFPPNIFEDNFICHIWEDRFRLLLFSTSSRSKSIIQLKILLTIPWIRCADLEKDFQINEHFLQQKTFRLRIARVWLISRNAFIRRKWNVVDLTRGTWLVFREFVHEWSWNAGRAFN